MRGSKMLGTIVRFTVFVVVTVSLTVWMGRTIIGVDGGDRYELSATFDDVSGLYDGDEVKLAGVTVGQVTGVEVVQGQAAVVFAVDATVAVPEDSTVAVRWRNLIGQRYLSLEPGVSPTMLAPGGTVARARDVVDLGRLVNQLAPLARSVSPEDLNRILETLVQAFDGNAASFDALFADLTSVLAALAERDATIGQMLADYDTITAALASRDEQIGALVSNLVEIAGTFADNDALLDQALVELSGFTSGLDTLLDRSAEDFGSSLDSLAVLTGTAAANVGELESALQALPHLFESLLPAVNRGEWLRVNVLCVTLQTGPCPLPMSFGVPEGGG